MKKKNKRKSGSKNNGNIRETERIEAPYPHFKKYLKSNHPAYVVGEMNDSVKNTSEYKYRKVMHSSKDGSRNNEKVFPNPNPNDSEPMYIGRRIRHDEKRIFQKNHINVK